MAAIEVHAMGTLGLLALADKYVNDRLPIFATTGFETLSTAPM